MKYNPYPKRDAIKNYFPLPNEIFMLGLCGVGCLIGWLLNYASGKGEKKHESEK